MGEPPKNTNKIKFVSNISIQKLSDQIKCDVSSKNKTSEKYWNNISQKISQKLTYLPYNNLSYLKNGDIRNAIFPNMNQKFIKTNDMRVLISDEPLRNWKMENDNQKVEKPAKITRKIRIYPNLEQKKLFQKCFGAHNYFYNKAVSILNKNPKLGKFSVRKLCVIPDEKLEPENLWMKEIPFDTRSSAVYKVFDARKTCLALLKSGHHKHFKLHFRSKKYNQDIFYITKRFLKGGNIFPSRLKENKTLISKKDSQLLKKSEGDFSITKNSNEQYFINIVIVNPEQDLVSKNNICALDPGIRTFQTMYSEEGIGEFGYNIEKRLSDFYNKENHLKSIIKCGSAKRKKYKLKKRCASLRTKMKNIVNNLHWQTCNYLTKNFQVILLPIFQTKQMVSNQKSLLRDSTKRIMLGLSHYSFQQKLLFKANQRGRNVIICKEHYTSKCCGVCGELKEDLGGKKIFHCNNCQIIADRDIHAARNILIRSLSIYFKRA